MTQSTCLISMAPNADRPCQDRCCHTSAKPQPATRDAAGQSYRCTPRSSAAAAATTPPASRSASTPEHATAYTTPPPTEQITAWWRQWPHANLGIATGTPSGLVVIDVDPHHGGEHSLRQLHRDCPLPRTAQAGSGTGRHLYYASSGPVRAASAGWVPASTPAVTAATSSPHQAATHRAATTAGSSSPRSRRFHQRSPSASRHHHDLPCRANTAADRRHHSLSPRGTRRRGARGGHRVGRPTQQHPVPRRT
jgi:hypothetical protein